MDNTNEYDILLEIFRFIRDYSTQTYSLSEVCRKLIKHLSACGYTADISVIDSKTRLIVVEGYKYKVLRHDGWSTYDVIMTA